MKLIILLFCCFSLVLSNQTDTTIYHLESLNINSQNSNFDLERLLPVENAAIYAGKKTEVINMSKVLGNIANNNSRQIFAKISGLNIWEGEGGGLQLSIGGRGLSPQRVSNFNTRQNGYDISADALGYPESYYTPPMESIDRIEIVRGAASLQYGTQFGGFLNFKLQQPEHNQKLAIQSRQTGGSFGLLNTFNSVKTSFKNLSIYSYFHFKRGDGWRDYSNFSQTGAHLNMKYFVNDKFSINFEYTKMYYLSRQPGGLTDLEFQKNPINSYRKRNWFEVDWNLFSNTIDFKINNNLKLNIRNFGLIASRNSLGILERPDRMDIGGNRDLIKGEYNNFGNETRLLYNYNFFNLPQVLIAGVRLYKGLTYQYQGLGSDKDDANFNMLNNNMNYQFPGYNISYFFEHLINITNKLSITPGFRIEKIVTNANGYYTKNEKDLAGNIISSQIINEDKNKSRNFALFGLGISYNLNNDNEVYTNFSQNYRAINFSDIRVSNPNFRIDPNLKDDNGWTYDFGLRGKFEDIINYDFTLFYVQYNGKIGEIFKTDSTTFVPFRERTNISDARTYGLESVVEINLLKILRIEVNSGLFYFINFSYIDAKYINSKSNNVENKNVELSPNVILKTGLNYKNNNYQANIQASYMSEQYTEATNTRVSSNAIYGIIPSYLVLDFSLKHIGSFFTIEGGINNLLNQMYFTRRAVGYPGPGIIPSDGINFYLNINFLIN